MGGAVSAAPATGASYRIAVDTGGTFTDVVLAGGDGRLRFAKALTTPARMFDGCREALRFAGEDLGLTVEELLAATDLFVYATTRATNAIIERTTAPTAFFTTEGFPDVLALREGGKMEPFNFAIPYPDPYVPRRLTFEIGGRIDAQGAERRPLDEDAVRRATAAARRAGVEAIGVCLLWSIAAPAHELRVRELVHEQWPEVAVTLSHELNPTIREYRRASSTVIDASLKPLMQEHLNAIGDDLAARGFAGELVVVTSVGGCLHVGEVAERPLYSVGSGPSMGPLGARRYAEEDLGAGDLIVCDAGGTSFDVSLIEGGVVKTTRETWLGPRFMGHITGLSSVEVTSIGAGGGSIAWIDAGGLLRVGPQSAGAVPGPACYGRGGEAATVTDAAVALGYFDPAYFLGGRMTLDPQAARAAIRRAVAEPLGLSDERAAWAILAIANEAMIAAIREITVNQGVDPRECSLVAGGGAGGLNAAVLARELGCATVLVPKAAGTLSACGAQFADVVAEVSVSRYLTTEDFELAAARTVLDGIDERLAAFAARLPGDMGERAARSYAVEARYPFQVWELEVPVERDRIVSGEPLEWLAERFHDAHERTFAVREPGQVVELQYWKGRLTAPLDAPRLGAAGPADGELAAPAARDCYFEETGVVATPCYGPAALAPGLTIEGPAILEEPITTVVVPPGCRATVTPLGSFAIDVTGAGR
jgi:N-methylhydantoinase A